LEISNKDLALFQPLDGNCLFFLSQERGVDDAYKKVN